MNDQVKSGGAVCFAALDGGEKGEPSVSPAPCCCAKGPSPLRGITDLLSGLLTCSQCGGVFAWQQKLQASTGR